MVVEALGDSALLVRLGDRIDEGTHARIQLAVQLLESPPLAAVSEIVPAYTTVTIFYQPLQAIAAGAPEADIPGWLRGHVRTRLAKLPDRAKPVRGRQVEVPVCYDDDFAPDLGEVARHTGISAAEVIRRHQASDFLVYLVGFAPGFPYMGGLPAELAMPRRTTPRVRVPAGSIGIIGIQCCIYPIETPGGWNLIGRTPIRLYRPESETPVLLRAGDRVKFSAITRAEFEDWEEA